MRGYIRIVSKNDFTIRTLTLLFEDAGYSVTDKPEEAELTISDTPLSDAVIGAHIYLADRGTALPKGVDAVIAKPFSWEELLGVVETIIRERTAGVGICLRADTLVFGGKSVKLTEREAKLFEFFKSNADKPVTREEMLDKVWGMGEKNTNLTDVYVNYLRKKLKSAFGAELIKSVRGVGYIYSEKGGDAPAGKQRI